MKRAEGVRPIIVMTVLLIAFIILATVVMISVYALPVNGMRYHAWLSSSNFTEGDHPEWANGIINTQLDCFSDSLIFNTATFRGTGNIVEDAMLNYYVQFDGQGIVESYVSSFDDSIYDSAYRVSYPRYWHGHLAFIKPLLLFLTTSEIMLLNMAVQLILLIAIAVKMSEKYGIKRLIAFSVPVFILNPVTVAQSLQYSQVYYVMLLHIAAVVFFDNALNKPKIFYIFLLNGILVAFFDFLTYPVVALGVPLVFVLSVDNRYAKLKEIVKLSIAWGVGYAGMWSGKWIVGSILTGTNVIENARSLMGTWTEKVSFPYVLKLNLMPLNDGTTKALLICLAVYCLYIFIFRKVTLNIDYSKCICIFLVGLFPFVWYFVMRTHSTIHYWMTFRNWAIAAYAIISIVTESLTLKKHSVQRMEVRNG